MQTPTETRVSIVEKISKVLSPHDVFTEWGPREVLEGVFTENSCTVNLHSSSGFLLYTVRVLRAHCHDRGDVPGRGHPQDHGVQRRDLEVVRAIIEPWLAS